MRGISPKDVRRTDEWGRTLREGRTQDSTTTKNQKEDIANYENKFEEKVGSKRWVQVKRVLDQHLEREKISE